ncbi:MAG: segregation/condensation protein A [Planctomycetaceae bacterium]|jgi:segregation and condensation protein A|nr:segregation/condensation protein A [Planctomycetaceae bacterium]
MVSFDVDLPCYHGPLDLLLYLIRREELDIESIQLSRIAQQYCQYIEVLALLDLENVSEFIDVMSQLMETKADRVLPQSTSDELEDQPQQPEDQDSNLVERLLQYKRFRDLASLLDEQSRQWQMRYGRLKSVESQRRTPDAELPIARIEVWDLVSAFGRILKSKFKPPTHEITYDNTPIQVYMQNIHRRLAGGDSIELQDFFETGMHKSALIATFLATLELTRYHGVHATQRDADGALILQRGESFPEELFADEEAKDIQ